MPARPLAASAALVATLTAPVTLARPAWAEDALSGPLPGETRHLAQIDGRRIAWREAGNRAAPTVLLLEEGPRNLAETRREMRRLARRFHVVVPDCPGRCPSAEELAPLAGIGIPATVTLRAH